MDISSMLEVQVNEVKETDSKENVTPRDSLACTTNIPSPISQDESNFYKLLFGTDISLVRFRKLHCTACDIHIGSAPADAHNMLQHPVLRTLLCAACHKFYGDGTFEQGDDATDMFCRWCANGGNLYCCSFCSNTFCYKCIKRNFDPTLRKKIEEDEKWKCFVCDPTDLYSARAVCWALLQHIQTVNRIIQNDREISAEDREKVMNFDETQCCSQRRRKLKRRRTASNSEEDEDRSYTSEMAGIPVFSKPKKRGRGRRRVNGNLTPNAAEPLGTPLKQNALKKEISSSPISCKQDQPTMKERGNTSADKVGLPPRLNTFVSRSNKNIGQMPMYNANAMNVLATSSFIQPSSSAQTTVRQYKNMNLLRLGRCAPTPMVTIPNQNANLVNQPRISFPEPRSSKVARRSAPTVAATTNQNLVENVIEIESDSDDSSIVERPRVSITCGKRKALEKPISLPAVPVALVSSKNNYETIRKSEITVKQKLKTLNERVSPHGKDIDLVLKNVKDKFQNLFESPRQEEHHEAVVKDGRLAIKQFHREIRNTVVQLAHINDRIVREYNRWKKHHITSKANIDSHSMDNSSSFDKVKEFDVPLEMNCVNESDSDSEMDNNGLEHDIISPSDLVGTTNVLDELIFKKPITTERAVGNTSLMFEDKAVQIYDMEFMDYENTIGHSVLTKSDTHSHSRDNVDTNSIDTTDANHQYAGKFEEQFIFYLQHIEDQNQNQTRKQMVERKSSTEAQPDPKETSLKNLIQANSPLISQVLESIDKPIVLKNPSERNKVSKENNQLSAVPETTTSVTCKTVDELVKIVNKITENLDPKKKSIAGVALRVLNESLKKSDQQKRQFCTNDKISSAINVVTNYDDSNKTNCNTINSEVCAENEEDCTIID